MADDMAKEIKKEESKAVKELKKNPWIIATFVFAIIALVLLIFAFRGIGATKTVSKDVIGPEAVSFINTQLLQGKGTVTLNSVAEKAGLYEVSVNYNGQVVPAYFTKDGTYYVGTMILPLAATPGNGTGASTPPAKIPTSDSPNVDLYVFAYCPYGLQAEKAFMPVYNQMKNEANFSIVYIGAMHGDFERVESLRQLAILSIYGKDKLFAYINQFAVNTAIGSCNGDDKCLSPVLDGIMKPLGISKAQVDALMNTTKITDMYNADIQQASAAGVSGSPTFIINGVEDASVARSPSGVQQAVCSAFNTAPADCSQPLSSAATSTGFGGSSGGSSSSAATGTAGSACAPA